MIPMRENKQKEQEKILIKLTAAQENVMQASIKNIKGKVLEAYSALACEFLNDLSGWLRRNPQAIKYPDVASVAFWCRKANIEKMKAKCADGWLHMGRGLLFHITPSNVPVNFAYSYFFGLLSGNANIVRIPSKKYTQVEILLEAIETVLKEKKYSRLREMTRFISYDRDKNITDYYSMHCDGRIIWGGDAAIQSIRQSPIMPKAVEVVFADRYSFGVIQSEKILEASAVQIQALARGFYNDTYLMDQNACSSPHCILWLGNEMEKASGLFWSAVEKEAQRYELEDIKAVDKYTKLCELSMEREDIASITTYDNYVYVVELNGVPQDLEQMRGQFGLFYQCKLEALEELTDVITSKSQTMITYGIEPSQWISFLKNSGTKGIDRVVTFGNALDIGVIWDGYDIISSLSRTIIV